MGCITVNSSSDRKQAEKSHLKMEDWKDYWWTVIGLNVAFDNYHTDIITIRLI